MGYAVAKHVHVLAAVISIALFMLRGVWMMAQSPLLHRRWVRIVPHVNDTVLLAAAIYLAATMWGWQEWIGAKIAALIVYVVLGTVALRRGRTRRIRTAAWLAALMVVGYIVAVAYTKRPWPFAG
jgi:uncharacterized membrane protein SirB2